MKLTYNNKKYISATIKNNEQNTSAEIAWCIRDRSSSYLDASLIWGIIFVLLANVFQLFVETNGWNGGAALSMIENVAAFFIGMLFAKLSIIRRLVVGEGRMRRQVMERALATFASSGVYLTKDHNGVLVFVSAFEKMVVYVADKAIVEIGPLKDFIKDKNNMVIDRKLFWDNDTVVNKCVDAINSLGIVVSSYFPKKENDVNELSDDQVEEK